MQTPNAPLRRKFQHPCQARRAPSALGRYAVVALVALGMSLPAAAQSRKARDRELGEMLAQSCMTCHGNRGTSTQQAMPTIGGQTEAYLNATMKAYRAGSRPSAIMQRIAAAYSTKELNAIAAYFSEQPFGRPRQATDPDKATRGEAVHMRKCNRCHLHNGRDSNEAESPLLAGQKLDYLRRNMEEVLSGQRSVEIKMDAALRELTREDIDATLHFYASQHGDLE